MQLQTFCDLTQPRLNILKLKVQKRSHIRHRDQLIKLTCSYSHKSSMTYLIPLNIAVLRCLKIRLVNFVVLIKTRCGVNRSMNCAENYIIFFFLAVSKWSMAVVRTLENVYGNVWHRTSKLADLKSKRLTTKNSFHMLGDWLLQYDEILWEYSLLCRVQIGSGAHPWILGIFWHCNGFLCVKMTHNTPHKLFLVFCTVTTVCLVY
jgi:hypothetical protein